MRRRASEVATRSAAKFVEARSPLRQRANTDVCWLAHPPSQRVSGGSARETRGPGTAARSKWLARPRSREVAVCPWETNREVDRGLTRWRTQLQRVAPKHWTRERRRRVFS